MISTSISISLSAAFNSFKRSTFFVATGWDEEDDPPALVFGIDFELFRLLMIDLIES